jgi:hypothetical protein
MGGCGCGGCCEGCSRGTGGTGGTATQGPGSPGNTGGRTGPGAVPIGTWLLIRYDQSDMGARPVPGGDVFWESPDIWITGGDALGNPIGGQPAAVFARVWNLGSVDAMSVRVDYSFIAPSLGIPASAPAPIGTNWTLVPALRATVVECPEPWIPPEQVGDLHSCLIVRCSAVLQNDTPTTGSAISDRHVGQHNMTVQEAEPGQKLTVPLLLRNLGPQPAEVELMASAGWRAGSEIRRDEPMLAPSLAGAIAGADQPAGIGEPRLWARRALLLAERPASDAVRPFSPAEIGDVVTIDSIKREPAVDANPLVPPANRVLLSATPFRSIAKTETLPPLGGARTHLTVNVPEKARDPWFVVHLAQATGGALTGGYTIACRISR